MSCSESYFIYDLLYSSFFGKQIRYKGAVQYNFLCWKHAMFGTILYGSLQPSVASEHFKCGYSATQEMNF